MVFPISPRKSHKKLYGPLLSRLASIQAQQTQTRSLRCRKSSSTTGRSPGRPCRCSSDKLCESQPRTLQLLPGDSYVITSFLGSDSHPQSENLSEPTRNYIGVSSYVACQAEFMQLSTQNGRKETLAMECWTRWPTELWSETSFGSILRSYCHMAPGQPFMALHPKGLFQRSPEPTDTAPRVWDPTWSLAYPAWQRRPEH